MQTLANEMCAQIENCSRGLHWLQKIQNTSRVIIRRVLMMTFESDIGVTWTILECLYINYRALLSLWLSSFANIQGHYAILGQILFNQSISLSPPPSFSLDFFATSMSPPLPCRSQKKIEISIMSDKWIRLDVIFSSLSLESASPPQAFFRLTGKPFWQLMIHRPSDTGRCPQESTSTITSTIHHLSINKSVILVSPRSEPVLSYCTLETINWIE